MSLDGLRQEIDGIDAELVRLLNERAAAAKKIGDHKRLKRAPTQDPAREDEVIARVKCLNAGPLSDEAIDGIYRRIIGACLALQEKQTYGEAP